jgi:hypothetical protein
MTEHPNKTEQNSEQNYFCSANITPRTKPPKGSFCSVGGGDVFAAPPNRTILFAETGILTYG